MIIGEVVGKVWSTSKDESLNGLKLLIVRQKEQCNSTETFVAADSVGAGIGEEVLVVQGNAARKALKNEAAAVDSTIVAIIDQVEMT